MARIDRKAAIDDYKKRNVACGIYLLTHVGTGGRWIGYAADLDQIANRILFTLRLGSHRSATLQAAWNGQSDGSPLSGSRRSRQIPCPKERR